MVPTYLTQIVHFTKFALLYWREYKVCTLLYHYENLQRAFPFLTNEIYVVFTQCGIFYSIDSQSYLLEEQEVGKNYPMLFSFLHTNHLKHFLT